MPFAGRLDVETEGLLICSDDGKMLNMISHGKGKCTKVYHVHVSHKTGNDPRNPKCIYARPLDEKLKLMEKSIDIKSKTSREAQVELIEERDGGNEFKISVRISDGKNRQVRRLCARSGFNVLRLIRVSRANISWQSRGRDKPAN